jgi:hypothetical protein
MVKAGLATVGAMTATLPPLSVGNTLAITAWNRCNGEMKFPDVLYALARDEIDDLDLMLMRLETLRDVMKAPNG